MRFKLTWKWYSLFSALTVTLAVALLVLVLELDMLVNGLLYEYGLVFDYEWALPYWSIVRLLIAMLGVLAVLNLVPTSYLFITRFWPMLERKFLKGNSSCGEQLKNGVNRGAKQEAAEPLQSSAPKQEMQKAADEVEMVAVPMICNKCGKVFNQPLCMFDFKSGKPRLVNVCPYCNALLAAAGSSEDK
jgi:uncharacterized Zn-finger protein